MFPNGKEQLFEDLDSMNKMANTNWATSSTTQTVLGKHAAAKNRNWSIKFTFRKHGIEYTQIVKGAIPHLVIEDGGCY